MCEASSLCSGIIIVSSCICGMSVPSAQPIEMCSAVFCNVCCGCSR